MPSRRGPRPGLRAGERPSLTCLRGSPSPWTPAALGADVIDWYSTLQGWTLDGSNGASAWAPKVGADVLSQAVAANRLVYSTAAFGAGRPGLVSPGGAVTKGLLTAGFAAVSQPITHYIVARSDTNPMVNVTILLDSGSATARNWLRLNQTNTSLYAGADKTVPTTHDLLTHLYCVIFDGGNASLYIDGELIGTGSGVGAMGVDKFGIGSSVGGVALNGAFGDYLVCRSAHDAATRARVRAYMQGAFGTP